MGNVHVLNGGEYEPGSMPPTGYMQKIEWVKVQRKAGLKQSMCMECSRWYFPQEFKIHDCTLNRANINERGQ